MTHPKVQGVELVFCTAMRARFCLARVQSTGLLETRLVLQPLGPPD